jgi:hypothetical protein
LCKKISNTTSSFRWYLFYTLPKHAFRHYLLFPEISEQALAMVARAVVTTFLGAITGQ